MESTTQQPNIDMFTQRLERLERGQRRWQRLGTLALAMLGATLFTAAIGMEERRVADEVRARAFVLIDREGLPVARWGQLPHGPLGLGFYDRQQKSRVLLTVDADGFTRLSLLGTNGNGSVLLSVGADGTPALRLLDKRWRVRASLATWPDGSPYLQLTDKEGKDRAILGYTEFVVTSAGTIEKRPTSFLTFFDTEGSVIRRMP
ncbi:hypothetical protein NKDENANG_00046 [Candidatus Entotheonellaceae bacterium PAL068K]